MLRVLGWVTLSLAFECDLLEGLAMMHISQFAHRNIMQAFLGHLMSLPMDFHRRKRSTELLAALEHGQIISVFIEKTLFLLVPLLADLFIAMRILWCTFGGQIALVMLLQIVSYFYVAYYGTSRTSRSLRSQHNRTRELKYQLQESITNSSTVSYFNQQHNEKIRLLTYLEKMLKAEQSYLLLYYWFSNVHELLLHFGLVVALGILLKKCEKGDAVYSSFFVLFGYWSRMGKKLKDITKGCKQIGETLVATEEMTHIFDTPLSVVDGRVPLRINSGEIVFKNVSFSYQDGRRGIVNVSFTVPGGKTVAVVGASGSGKSTLAHLVLRRDDVAEGAILIDGQDIKDVLLSDLRSAVGIVEQDATVFDWSIKDNLRLARPNATDEEVMMACKAVGLHDTILKFEKQYATKIGEAGRRISGGEKQRIAIARVLLRAPKVIILDEATSAIDTATEALVHQTLRDLKGQCSIFIIAHRLQTIKDADLILVLEDGQVVEEGTHQELLKQAGKYRSLWSQPS